MTPQVTPQATGGAAPQVLRLPIDEAARVLGISRATVRRRLRSGGLTGEQVSGPHGPKWVVHVPEQARAPVGAQEGSHAAAGGAELVAAQEAHIADLRRQLEDRTREVQELHVTINRLLLALPPPPGPSTNGAVPHDQAPETQHGTAPHEGERRRWWERLGAWLS
jgi:excisionase family DNA binding protein